MIFSLNKTVFLYKFIILNLIILFSFNLSEVDNSFILTLKKNQWYVLIQSVSGLKIKSYSLLLSFIAYLKFPLSNSEENNNSLFGL